VQSQGEVLQRAIHRRLQNTLAEHVAHQRRSSGRSGHCTFPSNAAFAAFARRSTLTVRLERGGGPGMDGVEWSSTRGGAGPSMDCKGPRRAYSGLIALSVSKRLRHNVYYKKTYLRRALIAMATNERGLNFPATQIDRLFAGQPYVMQRKRMISPSRSKSRGHATATRTTDRPLLLFLQCRLARPIGGGAMTARPLRKRRTRAVKA
jgi:hypothetical protein